jgi:glycine/D-amino acid oxidase-like deaminating enzyme
MSEQLTTATGIASRIPPSTYRDTAPPAVPTPPLRDEQTADVAIIGGGLTGLSTALHLAEQGVKAVVLEAHEPGWGASGRNGGHVNPGLKHDPDQVERDFGAGIGRRMVAFSSDAPNRVFELIERYQLTCESRQSGTLRAAYTQRSATAIRGFADQCARRAMPVDLLERDAIAAATGTDRYICALLDRRGGFVNPLAYARGLARAAVQQGAVIYGNTPVESLRRAGDGWRAQTAHGSLAAPHLVIATNGYTGDLWPGLRRSVVPVFSGITATEPLPDHLAASIMPTRSVLYEAESITTYYRVDPFNRLLMGGRSTMRDVSGPDGFAYLARYACRLWPTLRDIAWTHGWNGQLAITADHYPHFHEPAEGVLVCLGYNGRGVAMSTAMGRELARRVMGTPAPELDMPVTTLKEIPFHGLWRQAAAARVVYGRIRDSLGL